MPERRDLRGDASLFGRETTTARHEPSRANDVDSTVYINAVVVTVDSDFSVHEAFSVQAGRIDAVGTSQDVLAAAPRGAAVVDLGGRAVLPGFVDAHAHTELRAIGDMARPSLAGLLSIEQILAAIAEAAAEVEPGEWIVTSPIGEPPDHFGLPAGLAEGRWPTRHELDMAAAHHPVYIPTPIAWPNPAIFNTLAMEALGLPEAADGVWCEVDDATGEPTGVVHGVSLYNGRARVMQNLRRLVPVPDHEAIESAIAEAMQQNLAVGVTSIYEGHLNLYLAELRALRDSGRLLNRVVCTYDVPASASLEDIDRWLADVDDARGDGTGDAMLRVLGVTVSLDGAIQFGKALMTEPYLNPDGERGNGTSILSAEELADIASSAARHDVRLNILAAGSGAIAITMHALRTVHAVTPLTGRRWVVQHFQHPTRDDIAELARMGVVAQTYSSVDFSKGSEIYRDRLAGDLWESVVPLRWWIDGGVTIAQGSDGSHYNPLFQIWESLRRIDGRTGISLLAPPKEVTRAEAIATYTINGAVVMKCEDRVGSIEPGKLADFVVLDRNILTCDVDAIRETVVLVTALDGRIVHDRLGLVRAPSAEVTR